MDNKTLEQMIRNTSLLAPVFAGVWSADNFPKQPVSSKGSHEWQLRSVIYPASHKLIWFQIVNASPQNALGTHWLLLGAVSEGPETIRIFAWDCLGRPLSHYPIFFRRLNQLYKETGYMEISLTLQNANSNMCGLYCLFLIHYIAKKPFDLSHLESKLQKWTEIDIIRFFNTKYKTLFRYTVV